MSHLLMRQKMDLLCFCDNDTDKQGMSFNNFPVFLVEKAYEITSDFPSAYVFIIASCFFEVIYQQLKSMGIKSELYVYLRYDPLGLKENARFYTEEEFDKVSGLYDREPYTQELLNKINREGFGFVDTVDMLHLT